MLKKIKKSFPWSYSKALKAKIATMASSAIMRTKPPTLAIVGVCAPAVLKPAEVFVLAHAYEVVAVLFTWLPFQQPIALSFHVAPEPLTQRAPVSLLKS